MCQCPTAGIIDIISKKWTLCVINALSNHGRLRFSDIITELQKISPKTLTKILKDLGNLGLVKREYFKEIPPRVEYSLTDKGHELRKLAYPLLSWIDKNSDADSLFCCTCACSTCNKQQF